MLDGTIFRFGINYRETIWEHKKGKLKMEKRGSMEGFFLIVTHNLFQIFIDVQNNWPSLIIYSRKLTISILDTLFIYINRSSPKV
jgi:hypothetical protein